MDEDPLTLDKNLCRTPTRFTLIHVHQGTVYVSNEMKGNMEAARITLKEAPMETPVAIGTVEVYHAALRVAYIKI